MYRSLLVCLSLAMLGGCSATSLRCSVDGDSSFVELYNFPQSITRETQRMAELCGFAYEAPVEPVARLNIIDQVQ